MTPLDDYDLAPGVPTVADYRSLRSRSGLSDKSPEGAAIGLAHTWYGVVVRHDGRPVGMGRIIGDGGCFFQIVDICVLPEHQGKGLGRAVMQALTDELERRAPARSYISLIADGDAHHLYRKFGFTDTAPDSIGMARFLGTA
ncbi:GNAT family N-acetyltransferase [Streptomyces sp. ID05-39B]|uniref:GNAT family N-acetyltransferase n=1 Tax=Streptomyces sp. ID05-39B TaxID=3028664 RepID=UPI0029A4AE8D|nr:GNAT family N-acetyltransferase [Streptomyces sp. ID05-39B]MDX3525946.1 GNAT family N-acetyltransferase [Streptomyces sp. ID05-39B]